MKTVYIASCVEDGGIHRYHMDENGGLTWVDKTPMDRPMYMTISDNKMYAVLRAPFVDNQDSGVVIYDILPDGSLANPSGIISAKGQVACHILVDEGNVYCANYISGSVIRLPDTLVVHHGHGINPARQESPHVHYVGLAPERKYICVVDLGLDTIFLYDKNLNLHHQAKVPDGHGARHIVFSDDGNYMFCVNELASTVSVFLYRDGELQLLGTTPLLSDGYIGENTAAAIRYHDGKAYVSNRGQDSISVLSCDAGKLKCVDIICCGGESPRDFDFVGDYLVITNERSNNICVRTTDTIIGRIDVPAPICIVFQENP